MTRVSCPFCYHGVDGARLWYQGTGKTVFLTILGHELLHGLRRRFGADVRMSGTGRRRSLAGALTIDDVFTGHRLMAQTAEAVNGRRDPAVFEWRQEHRVAGMH